NLNADGSSIISPIKTSDKHNVLQDVSRRTLPSISLNVSASINNLLSSKQLEPVQVHSVVSSGGQQAKQQQPSVIQSVSVKPLLNSSPSSSNTKSSNEM
ncbi:unnamed protein product, partial [Rotaria socialis]